VLACDIVFFNIFVIFYQLYSTEEETTTTTNDIADEEDLSETVSIESCDEDQVSLSTRNSKNDMDEDYAEMYAVSIFVGELV
jgi:hypothetical protein